jgi:hypothetical protein
VLALARPLATAAAPPPLALYQVGSIPVAPLIGQLEFPLLRDFRGEVGFLLVSSGTYRDRNPFAYLSLASLSAIVHYDGVANLRLSAGFQEAWSLGVSPIGLPDTHQERAIVRARLQQPLGGSALYELVQLDLKSFDLPTGNHQFVLGTRFRVGQGFNLDAVRIHSLTLFEEVGLRFAEASYTTRAFDFFRVFFGYTWTTRRGAFVTLGLVGQLSENPPGNRLDFLYGPLLNVAYRILPSPKTSETPPEPQVDLQ